MALRISQADPAAIGERWVDFDKEISFKIAGIDTEAYQIALERARRLIAREDAGQTLANLTAGKSDRREHDIQCDLLGRYIVLDWKGPIEGDDGKVVAHSPELAAKLLRANVAVFAWVITEATKVAIDSKQEVAETVGKRSSGSAGNGNGRAKAKSRA